MSLNLHLYRHFVVLAEELHYGRAAARLHIVQPALSRSIKVLEERLGVRLIDRTSRRVALTPAGVAFLHKAREALAHFDEAVATARRVGSGEAAPLRIGFGASAMYRVFPDALRQFHEKHQGAETLIIEDTPERVLTGLNNTSIDLAVVQKEYMPGPPIQSRALYSAGLVAVIPAAWPLARRRRIHLRELNGLPFVYFPPNASPMIYGITLSVCSRCGLVPRIAHTAQSANVILTLVANELGYSLMNDSMRELPLRGIAYVEIADPEAAHLFQYEMAWRPDNATPLLKTFLSIVQRLTEKRKAPRRRLRAA